jgi:AcrR family transcriptional regulator
VTGSLLVSLALLRGAEVFATAGPHSHERVAALGARHVIDYHEEDWPDQVLAVTGPGMATVLFRLWVMSPLNRALDKRAHRAEPAFDRLLTAARKLFAAEGYAGTSLDAVCDRAGVTKGSLYHHFRGKTELFEAVFEAEARWVTERAAAAMAAEEDPWAAANAALTEFLDSVSEPGVQRILFQDAPSLLGWARVREIDRQYGLALVQDALDRLVDAGRIQVADPPTMAHLLLAALIEAALLRMSQAGDPGARDRVDGELRALLTSLIPR